MMDWLAGGVLGGTIGMVVSACTTPWIVPRVRARIERKEREQEQRDQQLVDFIHAEARSDVDAVSDEHLREFAATLDERLQEMYQDNDGLIRNFSPEDAQLFELDLERYRLTLERLKSIPRRT